MNKWSEIKQATLNKLFLEESEAMQQGYLEKFQYLANECLNSIANIVKPRISVLSVANIDTSSFSKNKVYGDSFRYDYELGFIIYNQNGVLVERIPEENTIYYVKDGEQYIFSNDNLLRIATSEGTVVMPDDFLSFADIIGYLNNEPDPSVVYLTDKKILLPKKGSYKIIYNALWNDITKDDVEQDNILEIDKSVLNCLPTYIASQLLSQDDVVRSATLKNEYEMLIAGLDTNIMYESNHYKSTGGWY